MTNCNGSPQHFAGASLPRIDPLLSERQLVRITGMSRMTIRRRMEAGEFPKPLKLSPNRVAWRASDIAAWQDKLAA